MVDVYDAVANADIVDDIDFDAEDVTVAKPDNVLPTLTLTLDDVLANADNVDPAILIGKNDVVARADNVDDTEIFNELDVVANADNVLVATRATLVVVVALAD